MPLGTNKDIEKIARQFRKRGGTVEILGSNHLRWTAPSGDRMMTSLTTGSGLPLIKLRSWLRQLEKSGKLPRT